MRRPTHPFAAAIVAVALVHGPALHVHARASLEPEAGETPSEADTLSDEAVAAFKAKDYDTAIDKFLRAYELDPQPNYKFNIGRVYEEKGDLENAVKYYQEFVQSPGVDLEAREAATGRLKVLRQALQETRAEEAKARGEADGDPTAGTGDGAADEAPVVDEAAKARKRKMRIAGYSLIGVGGVGLVIGSVFGGLALSKSRKADDEPLVDQKVKLRQESKTRAAVADGMLITGGVLAGVGLILVLSTLGKKKAKSSTLSGRARDREDWATWVPAPMVGPRAAGLSWAARF
jgi:tetratricopeptide (TPR) repeat protein